MLGNRFNGKQARGRGIERFSRDRTRQAERRKRMQVALNPHIQVFQVFPDHHKINGFRVFERAPKPRSPARRTDIGIRLFAPA